MVFLLKLPSRHIVHPPTGGGLVMADLPAKSPGAVVRVLYGNVLTSALSRIVRQYPKRTVVRGLILRGLVLRGLDLRGLVL